MNELRIYFSSDWQDSASPCAWAVCDGNGGVLQSGHAALAAIPKGVPCTAILSAERVLCIPAQQPAGARRRWYAALPFVAEGYTLTDPEDNHVAPCEKNADGAVTLQVVDKAWMRRIVEATRVAGLELRRAISEALMPALPEGGWTLVWDGAQGFLRYAGERGYALDQGDAGTMPLALRLALNKVQPECIEIRYPATTGSAQQLVPHWDNAPPMALGRPWDWRRESIPGDAPNLLWGEFSPPARMGAWWPVLRPALWILLGALLVETLAANVEWALLAHDKRRTKEEITEVFRGVMGDGVMQVDAPLQVQRQLAQLRHQAGQVDGSDFLPLLDASSLVLASLPEGSVRELRFESGRLEIIVRLPDSSAIASLGERLRQQGVSVEVGEIKDASGGAEARLLLARQGG